MNKFMIGFLSFAGILILFIVIVISTVFGVLNRDADLRALHEAQQNVQSNALDQTVSIITQSSSAARFDRQSAIALMQAYAANRGGVGNSSGGLIAASVLHEAVPNLPDGATLITLQRQIEAQWTSFRNAQDRLADIQRQHDVLRTRPVSGWILRRFGNTEPLTSIFILTAETNEAATTGVRRQVNLNLTLEPVNATSPASP